MTKIEFDIRELYNLQRALKARCAELHKAQQSGLDVSSDLKVCEDLLERVKLP